MTQFYKKAMFHINLWSPVVALVVVVTGVVLMIYPYKTIEVFDQPMPVSKDSFTLGESVKYKINFCRHTESTAHVSRFIVLDNPGSVINGEKHLISQLISNLPRGCSVVWAQTQPIPADIITPNRFYVEVVVKYQVNPLRTVTKTFRTESFNVE